MNKSMGKASKARIPRSIFDMHNAANSIIRKLITTPSNVNRKRQNSRRHFDDRWMNNSFDSRFSMLTSKSNESWCCSVIDCSFAFDPFRLITYVEFTYVSYVVAWINARNVINVNVLTFIYGSLLNPYLPPCDIMLVLFVFFGILLGNFHYMLIWMHSYVKYKSNQLKFGFVWVFKFKLHFDKQMETRMATEMFAGVLLLHWKAIGVP